MAAMCPVGPDRSCPPNQPACPAPADRILSDHLFCTSARWRTGCSLIFSSTSYKISLSKVRSPTSCFNFRSSSSSYRSRRISAMAIWPYCLRQK